MKINWILLIVIGLLVFALPMQLKQLESLELLKNKDGKTVIYDKKVHGLPSALDLSQLPAVEKQPTFNYDYYILKQTSYPKIHPLSGHSLISKL